MKHLLRWTLAVGFLGLLLAVAVFAPLPVPPYLDFQVIYHADMGLLRGIPLYDQAGQVGMIAELAGVLPEQVFVLPFPYPPWYALLTLPLALLPIGVAARLWLELNVVMLMLSIWLLSDGWGSKARLIALPLSLFFLPVLGGLYVGQYGFPVLLGLALSAYALRHEKPLLIAAAAALLTFKPHLGIPICLATLLTLWPRRLEAFPRQALFWTGLVGVGLFGIGFLADPAWPAEYFRSLVVYGANSGVLSCDLCASLSVEMVHWLGGTGLQSALWIAGGLAAILLVLIAWKWKILRNSPEWTLSALACAILLTSPYLQNYDYLLLLVPMAYLVRRAGDWRDWFWISLAVGLPWLGLGLFGRAGNSVLVVSTLLLAGVLYTHIPSVETA